MSAFSTPGLGYEDMWGFSYKAFLHLLFLMVPHLTCDRIQKGETLSIRSWAETATSTSDAGRVPVHHTSSL
jgi:hypothetical protein